MGRTSSVVDLVTRASRMCFLHRWPDGNVVTHLDAVFAWVGTSSSAHRRAIQMRPRRQADLVESDGRSPYRLACRLGSLRSFGDYFSQVCALDVIRVAQGADGVRQLQADKRCRSGRLARVDARPGFVDRSITLRSRRDAWP